MRIKKVYNNNLASILSEEGREVIIMGKGIAFGKRCGDEVDESKIDKRFYQDDDKWNDRFIQLLNDIPSDCVEFVSKEIEFAKTSLNKEFRESVYVSLMDHIYSSISRYKEGVTLKNPMLWEISRFYEPEFEVGLQILDMINDKYDLQLPQDEAGFIAMHLVDAEMDDDSLNNAYVTVKIIQDITNIVRHFFHIEYDTKSVYYYRFITHIRFFAQRLVLNKLNGDAEENDLFEIIRLKYPNAYECVKKIDQYIQQEFGMHLSQDEQLYLMIHIERIVYKQNK